MHIYSDMTDKGSVDFLRRLKLASPIKINKILTDSGSHFTDQFGTKDKKSSGQHSLYVTCAALPTEHRLPPPRHPQTNDMVERFTVASMNCCSRPRFDSSADLPTTLMKYLKLCNEHIPQRALDAKTPILAPKNGSKATGVISFSELCPGGT